MAQEGTCTLGRIGVTTANGGDGVITLTEPYEITATHDGLTLHGYFLSSTGNITTMTWVRDMILGLADHASEPVIPCTFSNFEHLNGYYRVASSAADRQPSVVDWTVELERVHDWRFPKVEIHTIAGITTNSHSITSGQLLVGNPGATYSYFANVPGTALGSGTVSNADGPFTQTLWSGASGTQGDYGAVSPFTQVLYVPASSWYKGGCRIEYDYLLSGSSYAAITDRRAFPSSEVIGRLRMSNGLVRVAPASGGGTGLDLYWWDGAAWDGTTIFEQFDNTAGSLTWTAATILRNTPEECAIRFATNVSNQLGGTYMDLSIRRGSRTVIGYLIASGSYQTSFRFGVRFKTSTSCTSTSGGLRRTSNDSFGNTPFILTDTATSINTGIGEVLQPSSGTPLLFGIGNLIGGTGASGYDLDPQEDAFWLSVSESQVVTAL